ncbi:MAG: type II toxin-antitoxin system death-on-curing family toxin [Chloroflexota bacterium]
MYYLSAADVYSINQEVLGREPIVRDRRLLQAAVARPFTRMFGQEAYPTLAEKAAALLHSLAHDHLFADGNKRTAHQAVLRFLRENGVEVRWSADEAYDVILDIAKGRYGVPEVARWLRHRTSVASVE